MVLATAIGWALGRFAALPNGLLIGLLVGMVGARFVPKAKPRPANQLAP